MTETHTALWLLVDILGVSIPSVSAAVTTWYGERSAPVITLVVATTLIASVLLVLAFLGYRADKKNKPPKTNDATSSDEGADLRLDRPDRLQLIELKKLAADAGWNTDNIASNDTYDLVGRLNQAAVDGQIKFWGRKYEYEYLGEAALQSQPILCIPVNHFKEGYLFNCLNIFKENTKNFYIYTGRLAKTMSEQRGLIYRDIYAERQQLVDWMDRNKRGGV